MLVQVDVDRTSSNSMLTGATRYTIALVETLIDTSTNSMDTSTTSANGVDTSTTSTNDLDISTTSTNGMDNSCIAATIEAATGLY